MDKALFQQLNLVYAPLRGRAAGLTKALIQSGFNARWGWYSDHSVLIDGEYRSEDFPIPVVEAGDVCEIGFNLDGCWLEFRLPRGRALAFDWGRLPEGAEVYGVEHYLEDFYHPGMDPAKTTERIAQSREQAVGIALSFPPDAEEAVLLAAAENCRRWKSGNES